MVQNRSYSCAKQGGRSSTAESEVVMCDENADPDIPSRHGDTSDGRDEGRLWYMTHH